MPNDVKRFLAALSPADRQRVEQQPAEQLERLAAAWEAELREDHDLDSLSEVSPHAAEEEAAKRILRERL
jgi:hypothetical protein